MKTKVKICKIMDRFAPALKDAIHAAAKEAGRNTDDLELKRASSSTVPSNAFMEGEDAVVQIVSTRGIDRDGEIVVPKGMDLTQFKAAGAPVLWGHDYSRPPLGSDEWIKLADGGRTLMAKSVYSKTPFAQEVFQLRKEGHLKTSSIGFIATEWIDRGSGEWDKALKTVSKWPELAGKTLDGLNRIITKGILLEHSDVPVPANPEAVMMAISKGLTLSDDMFESLKIERILGDSEPDSTEKAATPETKAAEVIHINRVKTPEPAPAPSIKIVRIQSQPVDIQRMTEKAVQEQIDRLRGRV